MAEGQGFEPWEPLDSSVFKTGAFDHSATPPKDGRRFYRVQIFCQHPLQKKLHNLLNWLNFYLLYTQFGQWARCREQIALQLVTATRMQEIRLRPGLYSLGHHLQP